MVSQTYYFLQTKFSIKMILKVEKRNGQYVDFDIQKIENAVYKALTFVKEGGRDEARELSEKVLEVLLRRFSKEEIPHVEEIQNIVEEVLISEGLTETARSYILYREKRREIRETASGFDESTELIEKYIDEIDWQVKENANMTYSLQGLNQYATSYISKKYWLNKIYPEKIREAAKNQDFHIHDLNLLATYCSGWDLQDLLVRGFGGVSSKVESKPPKHFRPALGQVVNFFFTLQGEGAGAQAMSNFDTLLAPFIRKDNLDYKQVKQSMQEFVFNCMVPTRVGFQCLSEDTEILTKKGWKKYNEVGEGDMIKTFNIDKKVVEEKKIKKIFRKNYEGKMYRVLNRIQDQLISPGHRMVRKKFNTENYCLETVEDVLKLKTSQIVSIAANNNNKEIDLKDEEIKLIAWIISEGSMEIKGNWRRIMIYQSREKNKEKYEEILSLLKKLKLKYSLQEGSKSLGGVVMQIRFDAVNSKKILRWFDKNDSVKRIPKKITEMSQRQSKIFLETYIKGDGHEGCKITVSDKNILNDLQRIIVNAGYGFTTAERMSSGVGNKLLYILRVVRRQETRIREIKKVNYNGVIWSVNTDNETVIAKRKGKVFITGNTPFLNISLDVTVPEFLKKQPIIIGGEVQKETYGEFQKEMDIFNRAFYEVLMQGDAKGRVFTFPIPTISITKEFDWENEALDKMWEATAKYGINYFSNFVQSDMNPEDFRSMCLHAEEEVFIKEDGEIKKLPIEDLFGNYHGDKIDKEWFETNKHIESISLNPETGQLEWVKINKFLKITDNEVVTIETTDGKTMNVSKNHLVGVFTPEGIKTKRAEDVNEDDFLLTLKDGSRILNSRFEKIDEVLSWFIGLFIADGNYLYDSRYEKEVLRGIQITFNRQEKELIERTKKVVKEILNYEMKFVSDKRYENSLCGYIYNSEFAKKMKQDLLVYKYGKLPSWIWSADSKTIEAVLKGFFDGDGYEKGKEIHINDPELSKDLNLLFQMVGISTTYIKKEKSQCIRIQHVLGRGSSGGKIIKDKLHNLIPSFLIDKKFAKDDQGKNNYQMYECKQVGLSSIYRWGISNEKIENLKKSDYAVVGVKSIKKEKIESNHSFYDIELDKNHYFVHSDGNITHNCCRLRLDNKELIKRGGGLFGSQPLTGCYDEQTEVLTENGWKFFKDVEGNEKVYTLSEDNSIELHKPTDYFEYKYEGEMYKFKAKSFDLLVTPNHRMVVDGMRDKKRTFVEAQDFKPSSYFIPKGGSWKGEERKLFAVPSVKILKGIGSKTSIPQEQLVVIREMREEGNTFQEISEKFNYDKITIFNVCKKDNYGQGGVTVKEIAPEIKVEMDDWLRFFGIWVAEGCTDNEKIALTHGYRTVISQNEGKVKKEIEELLKRMPFKYSVERRGEQVKFVIFSKQLWTYLRQFGNKYEKFIPKDLKNLSKRQIKILFDWMVMGDGHVRKTSGQINYWTSSEKLADDIQEIVLKLGWMATLSKRKKKSAFIDGRKINSGVIYTIGVQQSNYYRFRKNNISKENYSGNVYCLEVQNNTLFVRRKGKVSWCGNSVGVVTINLPRIGYLSKTKEDFYKRLSEMMDLAKESLELKRKVLDNFIEKGLYPYTKHYLSSVKKMRGSYFGNHFSTIGLIGMNEALLNFMGKNIATKEGKDFALEVLTFMRGKLVDYQEETDNLYNLEATPGEGASFRQAKTDRERYVDIITAGTKDAPYYTNSVHLPVNYTDDPFEALDLQDELQQAFTGGTVIHLFLGERISTPQGAKNIVRKVFDNYHLPYITLSPTFSICTNCGYIKGESLYCPNCKIKAPKKAIKNLKDYRSR